MEQLQCKKCLEIKDITQFKRGKHWRNCRTCRQCQNKTWEQNKLAQGIDPHKVRRRAKDVRLVGPKKDHYEEQRKKQTSSCAICYTKEEDLRISLCADHCHKTGKNRGLLCDPCNRALGLFKDDPLVLRRAASYIEKWS